MSKGTIWGKLCFGEERYFSRILHSEQRDSGILIKNSCKVVKIAFYVSRLTFWGIFSKKYDFFQHFRKMSKKLSNYGPKISGRFFKSFHLKSLDKHLEDFFEKSAIFSSFLDFILKNLSNFCRKSSASLSEMHYRCQGEHFEKKTTFPKKIHVFSDRFWTSSQFLLENSTKIIQHGCQTSYFAYTGEESQQKVFLEKKTFSFDVSNLSNKKIGGE